MVDDAKLLRAKENDKWMAFILIKYMYLLPSFFCFFLFWFEQGGNMSPQKLSFHIGNLSPCSEFSLSLTIQLLGRFWWSLLLISARFALRKKDKNCVVFQHGGFSRIPRVVWKVSLLTDVRAGHSPIICQADSSSSKQNLQRESLSSWFTIASCFWDCYDQ